MIVALALATAPVAQAPVTTAPATAAPTAPRTPQQLFDAASAALAAHQWEAALADLDTLRGRPALLRDPQVAEAILVRRATALRELDRLDEAFASATAAIALRPDSQALATDRFEARLFLAKLAYLRFNYPGAKAEAEKALAIAPSPADAFSALVELTRDTMFDEGAEPRMIADRMLAAAGALPQKKIVEEARILRARVLIAHGDLLHGGYDELKQVLAARGGLTKKINLSDGELRADLSMAALLSNDKDQARTYMANTGAGRIGDQAFATATNMDSPPCGGEADIRPDDMAVVELGIGDDGTVTYAAPVYASRPGPIAAAFARAVSAWSWRKEELAHIPPFYRVSTRVELRCSTAAERPPLTAPLALALAHWLYDRGVAPVSKDGSDAARLGPLRAELVRREATGESVALLPVLIMLGESSVRTIADRRADLMRAEKIAVAERAPARALAYLRMLVLDAIDGDMWKRPSRALLAPLAEQPDYAADATIAGVLRLAAAEPRARAYPPEARALLQAVADDARLEPTDPLRIGALTRLASLQFETGDVDGARASYARTGLSAQQCALVDAQPAMKAAHAGSDDFPTEAMQWRFEGWVRTEFDVASDGHTLNQRAIVAYPPFVFRDAGLWIARGFVYHQSYRPAGGLGCGGATRIISFRVPH